MQSNLIIALAGAAALSFLSFGAASASDHHLRYNVQELETATGAAQVYKRISRVAKAACGEDFSGTRAVKYRDARNQCVADKVEALVHQVDHPRVYEAHAAAGGRV